MLHALASKARRWCTDHAEAIAAPTHRRQDCSTAMPTTGGRFSQSPTRPAVSGPHSPVRRPRKAGREPMKSWSRPAPGRHPGNLLPGRHRSVALRHHCRAPRQGRGAPLGRVKAGKPMTATGLARLLAPFKIAPTAIRDGGEVFKGYTFSAFDDAFERYQANPTVTPLQTQETSAQVSGSEPLHVQDLLRLENSKKPNNDGVCNGVTVQSVGVGSLDDDDLDIPPTFDGFLLTVRPPSAPRGTAWTTSSHEPRPLHFPPVGRNPRGQGCGRSRPPCLGCEDRP